MQFPRAVSTYFLKTLLKRTNSSANILAARDTWSLGAVIRRVSAEVMISFPRVFGRFQKRLTDDEGYHGGAIASGLLKALDEFLHFPYFNVLLGFVRLWGAHNERRQKVCSIQ